METEIDSADVLDKVIAEASEAVSEAAISETVEEEEPNPVLGSADIKAAFDSGC